MPTQPIQIPGMPTIPPANATQPNPPPVGTVPPIVDTQPPAAPPAGDPAQPPEFQPPEGQIFTPGVGWHYPGQGGNAGGSGWTGYQGAGGGVQSQGGYRPNYTDGQTYGGINPTNVADPTPNWGNYSQFGDTVWADFNRRFEPQRAAAEARFNQDMVNRGIAQGSEAYTAARADFDRGMNDQMAAAQLAAQQATLGAQNQFWNQSATESQLANALAQARIGANASMYGADQGVRSSMYGHDIGRANFLDNLGYQRERGDMSDLMSLLGMGNQNTAYNNSLLGMDQERASALLGLIPGVNPTAIDVTGPYAQQAAQQQNNANAQNAYNQQQQQQYMQMAALAASMFLSDKNSKTDHGEADGDAALDAIRAAPSHSWTYHGDTDKHVGPMAQDFNMALHGEPRPMIAVQDAVGANWAATQALDKKVQQLAASMAGRKLVA